MTYVLRPGEPLPPRCKRCRRPLSLKPKPPFHRRPLTLGGLAVAAVVAILGLQVIAQMIKETRRIGRPTPAQTSPREQFPTRRSFKPKTPAPPLSEVYARRTPEKIDPVRDETAVRAVLDGMVDAHGRNDRDAFLSFFNIRRLLAQAETIKAIDSPAKTREEQKRDLDAIADVVASEVERTEKTPDERWTALTRAEIKLDPLRGEATASVRIRAGRGPDAPYRFWLIKEDGRWTIYDFLETWLGARQSEQLEKNYLIFQTMQDIGGLTLARMQLDAGQYQEALGSLESARKVVDPSAAPLLEADFLELDALIALRRDEDALKTIARLPEPYRSAPFADEYRSFCLLRLRRYEECIEAGRRYLRIMGDDPTIWMRLSQAYRNLGREEQAAKARAKAGRSETEQAVAPEPSSEPPEKRALTGEAGEAFERGKTLLAAGKSDEALEQFLEASQKSTNWVDVLRWGADELQDARAGEALLKLSEYYLKESPDDDDAYYRKAMALIMLGKLDEAEAALRVGLERTVPHRRHLFLPSLAAILAIKKRDAEALPLANEAVMTSPDLHSYRARFIVHVNAGRADRALADLEAILRIDRTLVDSFRQDPALSEMWKDPRWQDLLRRYGSR